MMNAKSIKAMAEVLLISAILCLPLILDFVKRP